jgi:hypothetical protein
MRSSVTGVSFLEHALVSLFDACSALHSAVHTYLHTIPYFQVRMYPIEHTIRDQPLRVVVHLVKHHLVDETLAHTIIVIIRL